MILSTFEDFLRALTDFGVAHPTFPSAFVSVEVYTECRSRDLLLEYRRDSGDTVRVAIDSPAALEDFETQLVEFWDDIDFREEAVEDSTATINQNRRTS